MQPSLTSARLINTFISAIALLIFLMFFRGEGITRIFPALALFFYPYFLKPSFAYFMSIYGALFFLIFLSFLNSNHKAKDIISGVALALAVLCQQFYMIAAVYYFLFMAVINSTRRDTNMQWSQYFYYVVPFLVPLTLFYLWGGLTNPAMRIREVSFSPLNLTAAIVPAGSALLPFVLFNLNKSKIKSVLIVLFISLLLVFTSFPEWAKAPNIGFVSGYSFRSLEIISGWNPLAGIVLKVIICFSGIYSILIFWENKGKFFPVSLLWLYIAFIAGFSFNSLPSERHLLPLIILAYLLAYKIPSEKILKPVWLGYQAIIGTIYFLYLNFIYRLP